MQHLEHTDVSVRLAFSEWLDQNKDINLQSSTMLSCNKIRHHPTQQKALITLNKKIDGR